MSNTSFQFRQLQDIRKECAEQAATFAATGAIAEIGVVENAPNEFTLNILNGPRKRNFENRVFENEISAVKCYASVNFESGKIRRNGEGRYLVFSA